MEIINIHDGTAPGAAGNAAHDNPTLEIYEPFGNDFRDCAVLIFPGGGYEHLSAQEGEGYAGWFQLHGFHAFVLNYRLGSHGYRHPAMLQDAVRAMRIVRSRAEADGFNPSKIVVIGSSAGGHLAATLLTRNDAGNPASPDPVERASSRPDLGILCYPVISMQDSTTHPGSKTNLLGANPDPDLARELSAETGVVADTPPCFLWHTWADGAVPVDNTLLFVAALRKAGVPFECHIYQDGEHGLGMKDGHNWTMPCLIWLKNRLGWKEPARPSVRV